MKRSTIIAILVLSLFFVSALGRREISPYDNKDASDDDVYKQRAQRSAAKRAAQNRRNFGGFSDDESDDEPRGRGSFKDDDDDEMKDTDPATRSRLKALERSFKEAFTQSKEKGAKLDNQIDMDKIRELLSQERKERGGNIPKTEQVTVPQSNEETEKISSENVEIPSSETISLKSNEEKISLVDL